MLVEYVSKYSELSVSHRCEAGFFTLPLLLQVAQSAAFAEQSLLKAATLYPQRAVLHALGFMLGTTCWQDDWHKMMLPAATHQPPSHPPSAFASLPSTAANPITAAAVSEQASIQALLTQLLAQPNSQSAADSSTTDVKQQQGSHDSLSLMQRQTTVRATSGTAPTSTSDQEPVVIDLIDEEEQEASNQRCEAVIESIRREEFGVGVVLDAAGSQLRQRQNERIGRALQRLSQELYSKDTHFVLELVQNADDNVYAAGVLPALEFVLQDTGIAVLNNEVGQCHTPEMPPPLSCRSLLYSRTSVGCQKNGAQNPGKACRHPLLLVWYV